MGVKGTDEKYKEQELITHSECVEHKVVGFISQRSISSSKHVQRIVRDKGMIQTDSNNNHSNKGTGIRSPTHLLMEFYGSLITIQNI